MEEELLAQLTQENVELESQLTKRNEQYIFDLKKALAAANFSQEQTTTELNEMLRALVEEQKRGVTARQLYGTVTERMEAIVNKPVVKAKSTQPFLMWLDNFLMFFALLAALSGIMSFFMPAGQSVSTYGLTAIILAAALGGVIFYMMYLFFYQYDEPGADKSKKPKTWKSILIIVVAFVLWYIIFNATVYLPTSLNPMLNPIALIILAAASLGLRFFLKKRFGVVSSFSSRPPKR
ncbi:DUF1129 domain-containing protein [Enterococcus alishanensis]|uniref:DUF1129 domain-containing protein n=1 Tax=Enterococcus alishanensis TaxID=1303817 RepID=A0ABS6TH05_9ENTE|nr:DUF1129 domain-containing protein [Enterococcus alishanensis]MBV7392172.1 DUF1129 domain-containing protein [Enterococcus alishanensis]